MNQNETQDVINQLDNILEQERIALLNGDLETIAQLLEQKEPLIDRLNALDGPGVNDLALLQGKVDRNQALLDGALQGIRRVASRMAAFRKIRRTLETYDESGQKRTIQGEVDHKVERRA